MITKICDNPSCGKSFDVPNTINGRGRKYCKQSCQVSWSKGKTGVYSAETIERKRRAAQEYYKTPCGRKHIKQTIERNLSDLNPWKHPKKEWVALAVASRMKTLEEHPEIRKTYGSMRGKHLSDATKDKIRQKFIQNIGKVGKVGDTMIGKNERFLLDAQEKLIGFPILRQFIIPTLGYVADGYCPKNNTIYEVYESHHQLPSHKKRDIIRQRRIVGKMKCDFVIIKDTKG